MNVLSTIYFCQRCCIHHPLAILGLSQAYMYKMKMIKKTLLALTEINNKRMVSTFAINRPPFEKQLAM